MRRTIITKTSALAWLSLMASASVFADSATGPNEEYTAADFAVYAPLNAKDMVERIPGFRLDNSRDQSAARGLGQATENVLINGQRVNSKSATAAETLERIPASTVERIEVLDGATLDIPGLSGVVVNVVVTPKGVSGTWTYRPTFRPKLDPELLGGDFSVSGQRGDLGWTLSFSSSPRGISGKGVESVFDPSSTLTERRDLQTVGMFPEYGGSLGGRWTPSSGLIANLNLDVKNVRRSFNEISRRAPVAGDLEVREADRVNETDSAELSTDVEFDAGPGRLKLIGVHTARNSPFTSALTREDAFGAPLERQQFRQVTDETETILRAEYSWSGLGGMWDASIENALNRLDATSQLRSALGSAALTPVDLGDPTVSVEENRSEVFITHSRDLTEDVSVQVSLGGEVSELSSSGGTEQSRTFYRPKGSLTLNWQPNPDTAVNARVERQVGQLDFFDFVSQLDLDDGEDQTGNADIVPEQKWRGEIELDRSLGSWGAGSVLVFAERLEDIVDQLPIGTGEGPGNIDRGQRLGITVEGTLNLDPIGVRGAQITYATTLQTSRIDDPLTGQERAINEEEEIRIDLEFRHDIFGTDLAWGGEITPRQRSDQFRLNSVRETRDLPGRYSVFIEHKDLWGLTGRAQIFQPLGNIDKKSRTLFAPDRTGSLVQIERSRVKENPVYILELSGRF